jgi:DNA-binding HxlR family transcriptional regulator/putative sterol carrier protein
VLVVARTYGQFCGVARALDLVGERWSLLVIRELLDGPKRYTDLLAGLPGIATDMLAARLRDLEAAGVVTRDTLPPPAASKVYALTALGQTLRPALIELARWGLRLLGDQGEAAFQAHWLALALQTMFRPARAGGLSLTVQFEIDGDPLHARIHAGVLQAGSGRAADAEVVITADPSTLVEIARDPAAAAGAVSAGRLRVDGDSTAVVHVLEVLGLVADGMPDRQ